MSIETIGIKPKKGPKMPAERNDDYEYIFKSNIRIEHDAQGEHWIWTGNKTKDKKDPNIERVGTFRVGRDSEGYSIYGKVDRWAYEYYTGQPVPVNKVVRPQCGHSLCVNPEHLFIEDKSGNAQVQFKKGNQVKQTWWNNQTEEERLKAGERLKLARAKKRVKGPKPEDTENKGEG